MCCYVGCYAVTALLTMLDSSRIQMQPAFFVVNSHVRISINRPPDLVLRKGQKEEVGKEVREVRGIGK